MTENEILELQKECEAKIITKQDLALLIEAIYQLKTIFGERYFHYKELSHLDFFLDKESLKYDMTYTLFTRLFKDLRQELIENNFQIGLKPRIAEIDNFLNTNRNAAKEDKTWRKIDSDYNKVCDSYKRIHHHINREEAELKEVDMIDLLLEINQYSKIIELIIDEKVSTEQKERILKLIIEKYPNKISDIFKTIPSDYYDPSLTDKENLKRFKTILQQPIKSALSNKEYNDYIARKAINKNSNYCDQMREADAKVKFLIEYQLIDINRLYFEISDNKLVTPAVVSYCHLYSDISSLGKFLYNSLDYDRIPVDIRDDSDIFFFNHCYSHDSLLDFIKQPAFHSTPEKVNFILKSILESNIEQDMVEKIIQTLLRKTKKEDYKDVQKTINSFCYLMNREKKILQQDLTSVLKQISYATSQKTKKKELI